jgi:hypothetical protein
LKNQVAEETKKLDQNEPPKMKILPFENIKLREDVIEPIFKVTKHR